MIEESNPLAVDLIFWLTSLTAIVGALTVVGIRNVFRSAIVLVGTMLMLAVIFFLLGTEFAGVIQILVNIGAVAVILIFAITLVGNIRGGIKEASRLTVALSMIAVVLAGTSIMLIVSTTSDMSSKITDAPNIEALGDLLLGRYLGVLEIVGVLIAVGTLGALVALRVAIKGKELEDKDE